METTEKTTDTEPTAEQPTMKMIVAQVEGVLKDFTRKANDALAAFNTISVELEKRMTARVEARAVEQSRAMKANESDVAALRVRADDQKIASETLSSSVAKLDAAVKETKRRMGEQGEAVKKVLETAKAIDEKAGERFGAKLDALGSQVASLATMGTRLEKAEAEVKNLVKVASAVVQTTEEAREGNEELKKDLAALRSVVEQLQLPKDEKPKAKAAEAKVS